MSHLKSINHHFFKYKWHLIGGILFIIISNYFAIKPAEYTKHAFDDVKIILAQHEHNNDISLTDSITKKLAWYCLLIIATAIIRGLFMFFMRQTIIVMSRRIEYDQKNDIYAKYQELSQDFFKQNNTGDLMNRLSEDVGRVRMYTGPAIMYIVNMLVLFAFVIYTMLSTNVLLTAIIIIPLPFLAWFIYVVSNKINKESETVQGLLSDISSLTQETFSGIRIIKAFVKEHFYLQRFTNEAGNYNQSAIRLAKIEAWFGPVILLFIGVSSIATIFIGGKMVMEHTISIGTIAEFVIYINMLTWPVTSIGWVSSLIQRAEVSQRRINEFIHTLVAIQSKPEAISLSSIQKIEFKNVLYTYADTKINALNEVNFTIEKGSITAIVGNTGSGKSTLANLLLRLYDVTHGELLINDINIKDLKLNNYRQLIGYVPQEVFLFSDSIANNISFGSFGDKLDFESIRFAAANAAVLDNIENFKDKFDTVVGEKGVMLSGGQKQRIAIARAFMRDSQLLILDDCLSAVDTETEGQILSNLKKVIKNKTVLIISHRISSVINADSIIVLDNGKIIEQGNHEYLLSLKGSYYNLYKQQLEKA